MALKRAVARVGARHVYLLTAGRGPPLLLLHGSPNSATALSGLIEHLAGSFLVVAPDTPGNGASDPLPLQGAGADAYADALAALLDALQLPRVGVYGHHTGAVFAAELARRHPQRVEALVCEGFPIWTAAEANELGDEYLPPLGVGPDGAHLARLWSRIIDQSWYFPWHVREESRRMSLDLGDTDLLHGRAMDLLRAGDAYRMPYAAALRTDGEPRLAALNRPALLTCTASDVLAAHLPRAPANPRVTKQLVGDREQLWQRIADWFQRHPPPAADLKLPPSPRRFVDTPLGQVHVVGEPDAAAVWLHDAGESSAQAPAGADHLRVDLPGHGLSVAPWPEDWAEVPAALWAAFDGAGVDPAAATIEGRGLGRQLAALLAGRQEHLETQAVEIPDIAPRWDGTHLLTAWHFARYRSQYQPWHERGFGRRGDAALPEADALQRMTLDLLRAGQETLARTLPCSLAAGAAATDDSVHSPLF